jgi:RimJ/RimL family protein N-acetyltransferase
MSSAPRYSLRPVRWEDFSDLKETYFQLYDERDSGEPIGITLFGARPTLSDEVAWFDQFFRRVLDGDEIAWVAEVDGHAVAMCTIRRVGAGPASEQSHLGELGILVRRSHRGTGLGTALFERALADARTQFELVYLSVFAVNERAQRLYQRFGFEVCGRFPRAVKRGAQYHDLLRMVLDFAKYPMPAEANR